MYRTAQTPVVVLVSSQHGGVGVIRSLGRQGVPVFGVHKDVWEPSANSRYLQGIFQWDLATAPAADSVAFLLKIAQETGCPAGQRPVLLATSDITAAFVAENAEALRQGFLFATSSAEVVRSFYSKMQTYDLCRKLKIPTPETCAPRSLEEVSRFAASSQFPVIVKGEYGEFLHNGRPTRVAIVTREDDLLKLYEGNAGAGRSQLILQEYIPGGDDTIWMFNGYFNDRSECLFGVTGRKLRQFPAHRGSTSLGVCEKNDVVSAQTKRLAKAVNYRGAIDLGYRFDARDGKYKLLDVNPRIGASFRLFVAENELDVALALYLDVTGQTVPPARARDGRKWAVENYEAVSIWTALREHPLRLGAWLRSLRGVSERAWFAWDDPAPFAMLPLWAFRRPFLKGANAVSGGLARQRRSGAFRVDGITPSA